MKKILASDYDGTLYINDIDLERNIENINKFRKNNNMFIIATGRSFYDLSIKIITQGLKYDYLVINHGATILNQNNEIIANYPIEENIKQKLIYELKLNSENKMFTCKFLEGRTNINEKEITKINVKYDSLEEAIFINNYLNEKYNKDIVSYLLTKDTSIEIVSANVNKAKAVRKISQLEKIESENIYTIGDSYNDIDMIKEFNGNCMIDSKKEVLELCNIEKQFKSVSDLIEKINQ